MNSIIFGFREILNWNTMLYALISGLLITALWVGIGIYFWDFLVGLSSKILELVPFSMVRSNGAWMLSTFLWLQLVLLTFALVFVFFGTIILRSVNKDKYTSFSLSVAGGSALFWGMVWYFKGDYIYAQFIKLLTWLPFETIEKGVAFLIGFYLIYNAILVSILFVASMFSEPLIVAVEKEHFKDEEVVRDNVFSVVRITIKDTLLFLVVSFLALPLLFVPILNIIVQITLWLWLIKNTLAYDAAALSYANVSKEVVKTHRNGIWFISFMAALFNFIPLLHLFGPYFGEIAMFHYMKTSQK